MGILATSTMDRLYQLETVNEGKIPFLYQDTRGFITTGVGFMLPTLADAQKLPWQPADPAAIASDWGAVKAAPAGKLAQWYKPLTKCVLPEAAIRAEFERRAEGFAKTLVKVYDLKNYPEPAVLAIMDMAFNLGAGALLGSGWPSFRAACLAKDWKTAAQQCSRKGISAKRNQDTANLFLSAV